MKDIMLDEQKEIMLGIMDKIHRVCEENNIKYYLAYGSLLGAIRHKGFIPWDDDMDIVMFRDDFEKFCKAFTDSAGQYELIYIGNNHKYYSNIPKVIDRRTIAREKVRNSIDIGVWVDVFIMDYLGDDVDTATKKISEIDTMNKHLSWTYITKLIKCSLWKKFAIRILQVLINRRKLLVKIDKFSANKTVSRYCGCIDQVCASNSEIMETGYFDKATLVEFEGRKYYAPAEYDEYLTKMYGDYMTPPPKDKQISHHACDFWWK